MTQCPYCKEYGAYVGAITVECPNTDCDFYSEEQRLARAEKILQAFERNEEELIGFFPEEDDAVAADSDAATDPDKTPVLPWGFPTLPKP